MLLKNSSLRNSGLLIGFLLWILPPSMIFAQNIAVEIVKPVALAVQHAKSTEQPFTKIDLFTDDHSLDVRDRFPGILSQASYLEVREAALQSMLSSRPEAIRLQVPYFSQNIDLELIRVDVLSDDFKAYTSDSPDKPINYRPGLYYRGIIAGDVTSVVALSFFDDDIMGMVSSEVLGNITFNKEAETNRYLLYSDRDLLVRNSNFCSTEEPENYAEQVQKYLNAPLEVRDGKCVKVYIECDYALYQNKGSVANVNNWISAVYNNVAALYANEQISTQISTTYVWTSTDPYSKTNSSTALTQFRNNRPTFNGDLAHLAALGGQNIGGVAWVDALCTSYKYAYSNIQASYQTVPTYSWTVEVMTHEMGHNLGSPHTQSCSWTGGALDNCYTTEGGCAPGPPPTNGGTIMSYCHLTSYGINFNNGFGTQPGNLIRARVNAVSCLGTCSGGGSSCNAPSGLTASNISNTSAVASWGSVSGVSAYQLQYRKTGGTWTVLNQQTTTSVTLTGLTTATTYEMQVRSICSGGTSNYSAIVTFTTSGGGGGCGIPTGLAVTNITNTTATISWNSVSGAVNYTLRYKLSSSGSWSTFTTTSTIVNMSSMTAGTSYDVGVRTNCSGGSSNYSATVTFKTTGGGTSYCTSKGATASYEWIDLVKLGSINNATGNNSGYGDFTSLNTTLTAGSTYTITLSAGMNGSYTEYWTVWIDYNGDGDFLDAGEKITSFASSSTANINRSFNVPTNAKNGATRMRVQMKYGSYGTSCETFSYGEVEDYKVTIAGGTNLPFALNDEITDYRVYPNPSSDLFTAQFEAGSEMEAAISVLDANGRVLSNQKVNTIPGNNIIPVETSGTLVPGMYLIRIITEHGHQAVRVVKM